MATESDKRTTTRRRLLQAVVGLGALGAGRALFGVGDSGGPEPQAVPEPQARPRPPEPPAAAYRLRPMAGETSRSGPGAAAPHADIAYTLSAGRREVFLTFDDGPHPRYTPQILRILRRHRVRATFFVIGENAVGFPGLLRAIAEDGHAVANHTWSHPQLTGLPPDDVRSELGRTSALIDDVLGAAPNLARAPYGAWDDLSLSICNELGMSPVGWATDSLDWTLPGAENIADAVLAGIRPGGIVLAHDGGGPRRQTVEALRWYLPRLLDDGYRPVPIEP
ncbi:polysaccharide deacetylase family protein [Streptomyces sp. NPDC001339]|uniref:polysaccharide deacetylase family protein n=1 Tax=Streptomyces sp. NPDC001339 TaxID=3364563 RepID=UPI0036C0ADAD